MSIMRQGKMESMEGIAGCDCAIKIFKTTLNEFSNRAAYIDGDPRFGKLRFNKKSTRAKFQLWAEKEARNLLRMRKAGIPCPVPLLQKEHVLVMSFLGEDGWPSPQLREWWEKCYRSVLMLVRDLYQKAGLVHGDLSEYNILWHANQVHLIDVGQAVHKGHAWADTLLARDLRHVHSFFKSKGVKVLEEDGREGKEGNGVRFVKMVYVEPGVKPRRMEGKREWREAEGGWGNVSDEEMDIGKESEAAVEILERLIDGSETWEEILKSVREVFSGAAQREEEAEEDELELDINEEEEGELNGREEGDVEEEE
ncbi:RIO kinase 1 [Nannochloropsis gaditana CCMP526]|uniref:RIO kinase 1 n=1 Tax=Nannochloropsis gaditana (strain CCMP526) TaxID=1093141 RepID=UPI00029F62DD|nr:RIO kinase 1 [Nannochloropsis gaditana CCMP526]EKU22224.1 RIO kinase 1 [Nannochloropsis gaditana CCMP526]|eukprot:XP_005854137.1 RIO kinase 1 [Nannochloropsis gaditana CCMP526]